MRNIPIVTKNLLIVNVVAFLACMLMDKSMGGGSGLTDMFGLHFFLASDFHIYQLVTYMFMHGGFQHILFNMFALWMFGCVVERVWGPKKFMGKEYDGIHRTTFIIDENGIIEEVISDVKTKAHAAQILK